MLKKIFNKKNIPYITIPITIVAFVVLSMSILNYSGAIDLVSNNFYVYINQDIQTGQVAGEYTVRMAAGCGNLNAPDGDIHQIQKAIDLCSGGTITLSADKLYIQGVTRMKSNITLDLNGSTIQTVDGAAGDQEFVPVSSGTNYPYFFYSVSRARNMEIKNGTIKKTVDKPMKIMRFMAVDGLTIKDVTIDSTAVPYAARGGTHLQVHSYGSFVSKNILFENVTIRSTRIPGKTGGDDGIDIHNSQNVTIKDSDIYSSDDAIAIVTLEGAVTRDITVENTRSSSLIGGAIKFGTGTHEDIYNITFRNVTLHDSPTAIRFSSMDGGDIRNVLFENVTIESNNKVPIICGCGGGSNKTDFVCDNQGNIKNITSFCAITKGCVDLRYPACRNDVDDDGDGLKDGEDPDCHSDGNAANCASYDVRDDDESGVYPPSFRPSQGIISDVVFKNVQIKVRSDSSYTIGDHALNTMQRVTLDNVTFSNGAYLKLRDICGLSIKNTDVNSLILGEGITNIDYNGGEPVCTDSPAIDCSGCSVWSNSQCGGGACPSSSMQQTRTNCPNECSSIRCIADTACDGNNPPPPLPKILSSDFNSDGEVNIQDFGILLSNWHKQGSEIKNKKIDINKDNIIDKKDLSKLLSCWGKPTKSESPECFVDKLVN